MKVGQVYVVKTSLARPPKDKITVCVSADADIPLFLWINSNPRRDGIGQFPLTAGDHSAPSRDCFLDCARVTTFPKRELEAAVNRGPISPSLANRIVEFLETSRPKTLPAVHLKLVIANLSALYR